MWTPAVAELAFAGPLHNVPAADLARHNKARRAARQIHASLFPED